MPFAFILGFPVFKTMVKDKQVFMKWFTLHSALWLFQLGHYGLSILSNPESQLEFLRFPANLVVENILPEVGRWKSEVINVDA